jgi:hypothetical protein
VLIRDNTFERFSPNASTIQGLDADHPIRGVTFDNLVVAGQQRANADDAEISLGRFVENVVFK